MEILLSANWPELQNAWTCQSNREHAWNERARGADLVVD
jgi:hypothetical protein